MEELHPHRALSYLHIHLSIIRIDNSISGAKRDKATLRQVTTPASITSMVVLRLRGWNKRSEQLLTIKMTSQFAQTRIWHRSNMCLEDLLSGPPSNVKYDYKICKAWYNQTVCFLGQTRLSIRQTEWVVHWYGQQHLGNI